VSGAGPVGLLAAMMGLQRDLEVHIYDHNAEGPKPALAHDLGVHYHSDLQSLEKLHGQIDIALECTGVGDLVVDVIRCGAPGSVICLTGMASKSRSLTLNMDSLNKEMVLDNEVVFGTVNANVRHFQLAEQALLRGRQAWLKKLITSRIPMSQWQEALGPKKKSEIKTVLVPG